MVKIAKPGGGRTRRRGGGVSLSSADVPIINPAQDPGLRVPMINPAGEGLQQVAGFLDQETDAAVRIVDRNEALARDSDDTNYSQLLSEELRNLQATADLSDEEIVSKAVERMREKRDSILGSHRGRGSSKAALENRLKRRFNAFSDNLAVLNITASDQRQNRSIEKRISGITQDVLSDPTVLTANDPIEPFRVHSGQLEDEIEFLKLRPDQAAVVRRAGQAEIAMTMIGPLIKNGQFERAKSIIRSKELREVLPPSVLRDAAQRVVTAEKELEKAKLEDSADLRKARILLGDDASDEQVRETAKRLAGIKKESDIELFEVGNTIVGVSKTTGAVVSRVQGETPEQEAKRTQAVERAKLQARVEVLNDVLQRAGVGTMFGAPGSGAPGTATDMMPLPMRRKPLLTGTVVGQTPEGRSLIQNTEGGVSSELSVTERDPRDPSKFINIPTIFNGEQVTPGEAMNIVSESGFTDPETGAPIESFDSMEEAAAAARQRSEGAPGFPSVAPDETFDSEPDDQGEEQPQIIGNAGSVQTPFGPGVPASNDALAVARLFVASRALLLAGETSIANGLLGQARFIAENSPEMRRDRDLDKPISPELSAELGVAVGTTLRQVMNVIPKSPAQQARDKQLARVLSVDEASELGVPVGTTVGDLVGQRPRSPEARALSKLHRLPVSPELAAELGVPIGTPFGSVLDRIPRTTEEVTRSRAMSTPISPEMAAELGVPASTTLGEVSDRILPSPDVKARSRAIAGARGRAQVASEEQVTFLQEARITLNNLLERLEVDPKLVGAVGALRAKGRSAVTLLEDIGMSGIVDAARDLAYENSEAGIDEIQGWFEDPTLSTLDIIENSVGLIIARVRTPAGRIPVELIKRSINEVGLKGLRGSKVIIDRIEFIRDKLINERLRSIKRRFPDINIPEIEEDEGEQQDGSIGSQVIPPGAPRYRIESGRLVPIPSSGSAADDNLSIEEEE